MMAEMIAVTTVTRRSVVMIALNMSSNVRMADVSWEHGNVMEIKTAVTGLMKMMMSVTRKNVTRRLSFHVPMVNVSPSCGTVTMMMTAEMTVTSLPTCVGRETVLRDGGGVPVTATTDVFLSGCSVMARMIVEMELMSCQRIVQIVQTRESSSAGNQTQTNIMRQLFYFTQLSD